MEDDLNYLLMEDDFKIVIQNGEKAKSTSGKAVLASTSLN
jgi:hypothetical protein